MITVSGSLFEMQKMRFSKKENTVNHMNGLTAVSEKTKTLDFSPDVRLQGYTQCSKQQFFFFFPTNLFIVAYFSLFLLLLTEGVSLIRRMLLCRCSFVQICTVVSNFTTSKLFLNDIFLQSSVLAIYSPAFIYCTWDSQGHMVGLFL